MLGGTGKMPSVPAALDTAMRGSKSRQGMVLAFDRCLGSAVRLSIRKILTPNLRLSKLLI